MIEIENSSNDELVPIPLDHNVFEQLACHFNTEMMQFDYRNLQKLDSFYSVNLDENESVIFNLCKNDFHSEYPNSFAYLVSNESTTPLTGSSPSPSTVVLKEHDLNFN